MARPGPGSGQRVTFGRLRVGTVYFEHTATGETGETGEPVGPGIVTGAEEDDLSYGGGLVLDEVIDQPGAGDSRGPGRAADEVVGGFDSRPHASEARGAERGPPRHREERAGQRVDEEARAGRPRRLEPALDRHERSGTAGPAPAWFDPGRAVP